MWAAKASLAGVKLQPWKKKFSIFAEIEKVENFLVHPSYVMHYCTENELLPAAPLW